MLSRSLLLSPRILSRRSSKVSRTAASALDMGRAKLAHTRSLHWVFRVADRKATAQFYQETLGMTALRHEEFDEACAAACNGPYDGKWSKTMAGYGPEDQQFVLELTYNYGIKSYLQGNDYRHIVVRNKAAYQAAQQHESSTPEDGLPYIGVTCPGVRVTAPGGYAFIVLDSDAAQGTSTIIEVSLSVTDLDKSLEFWHDFLGFSFTRTQDDNGPYAVMSCGPGQATLRLVQLPEGQVLDRGSAFGRVAFSTPGHFLQPLEEDVKQAGFTVLTPYVSLDTPGKATVQVVILADPDGHEICFVGEEGFAELSKPDPAAGQLLSEAIANDKSEEWLEKRARMEAAMAAKGV